MVVVQIFTRELMKFKLLFTVKLLLLIFAVLESKAQENIVLGRSFLRSIGGFIDVRKGLIRFRSPIKHKFSLPLKEKEVLIEGNIEIDFEKTC